MDCKICFEPFDAARCRPKVLPCGHSACLDCLELEHLPERRCPECPERGEQGRGEAAGRDGAQDGQDEGQDEGQGGAAPDLPVLEEMKVEDDEDDERKEELLRTAREHRVRRLTDVRCEYDPDWSLQLLQLAAPHVEELQVYLACGEDLEAVLAMPRLRRLAVHGNSSDPSDFPAELPPLPADHVGLRWLCMSNLPFETTFSVIRRHAGTLEELWLEVGTPGEEGWPCDCNDLHAALGRCGLAGLRRLVLERPSHDAQSCSVQLGAVRAALPGVTVQCDVCDSEAVKFEF